MSVVSFCIALFFILVHYDFISRCEEGGWLELSSSFFLILLWTIALAITTQDQGIAATLTGTQCGRDDVTIQAENCTIIIYEKVWDEDLNKAILNEKQIGCGELPRQVPGSNLYFATWTCFFASLNISFRWKAQQALQFAQAQQEKRQRNIVDEPKDKGETTDELDDDDDDEDM